MKYAPRPARSRGVKPLEWSGAASAPPLYLTSQRFHAENPAFFRTRLRAHLNRLGEFKSAPVCPVELHGGRWESAIFRVALVAMLSGLSSQTA